MDNKTKGRRGLIACEGLAALVSVWFAFAEPVLHKEPVDSVVQSIQQVTFQDARENPALRQAYLDKIMSENPLPFPCTVEYDSGDLSVYLKRRMEPSIHTHTEGDYTLNLTLLGEEYWRESITAAKAAMSTVFAIVGANKPQHIIVYPVAFEESEYENWFLINLNHELGHANDFHYGFDIGQTKVTFRNTVPFNQETLKIIQEIFQYSNDSSLLDNTEFYLPRQARRKKMGNIASALAEYWDELEKIVPESELERKAIESVLSTRESFTYRR
jgi:hypothetical protein